MCSTLMFTCAPSLCDVVGSRVVRREGDVGMVVEMVREEGVVE